MPRSDRPATEPTQCKSCGASILWTTTQPNGKSMPVDALPSSDGTFIVNHRAKENRLIAIHVRNVADDALPGRNRYHSHFSTCPNAKEHRKATAP